MEEIIEFIEKLILKKKEMIKETRGENKINIEELKRIKLLYKNINKLSPYMTREIESILEIPKTENLSSFKIIDDCDSDQNEDWKLIKNDKGGDIELFSNDVIIMFR